METFGENLTNLRKQNHLTQKQVGEKLGFAARTVSDWENDKNEPKIDTLKKIAKLFDVTCDELLDF